MTAPEMHTPLAPLAPDLPLVTWTAPAGRLRHRSILVMLEPGAQVAALLERAIALAVRDHARLTLLTVVPEPPATIWFAPLLAEDPRRAIEADRRRLLRAAVRTVPITVPVTTVLVHDRRAGALVKELRRGEHDLVLMSGTRGARAARALVRRSDVTVMVLGEATKGA